jgi:hypothetical protein
MPHSASSSSNKGVDGGVGSFTVLPFDELSSLASARPSTAGGTCDLIRAVWANPSADSRRMQKAACLPLEESTPFDRLDPSNLDGIATLSMFPYYAF